MKKIALSLAVAYLLMGVVLAIIDAAGNHLLSGELTTPPVDGSFNLGGLASVIFLWPVTVGLAVSKG